MKFLIPLAKQVSKLFTVFMFCSSVSAADQSFELQELQPYLNNPKLVGSGPLTYLGFKVYDAHFYSTDELGKSGFALRLNYARKVTNEDLVKATVKQMVRLGASDNEIIKWQSELEKIYPNVDQGHHITAIYQPSGSTTFIHNGKLAGKINDQQFSKIFFSIWFDQKTNSPNLRTKLLGELCPPSIISNSCIK
jgi:hypothetical protein